LTLAGKTNQPATVDEAWYNRATAEAARGRRDEAFADLDRAVENGLVSPGYVEADTELRPLHGDPRFEAAVAKARAATQAGQNSTDRPCWPFPMGHGRMWPNRTRPHFLSSVRIRGKNEAAGAAVAAALAVE